MTDLNSYLRRVDVEALLEGKIAALGEDADRSLAGLGGEDLERATRRSADARAKRHALVATKAQLGFCQQFTYRSFTQYDGVTRYNALVDATADRVPLEPVADEIPMAVAA